MEHTSKFKRESTICSELFSHLKAVFYGSLDLCIISIASSSEGWTLGITCVAAVSLLFMSLSLLPAMHFRQVAAATAEGQIGDEAAFICMHDSSDIKKGREILDQAL